MRMRVAVLGLVLLAGAAILNDRRRAPPPAAESLREALREPTPEARWRRLEALSREAREPGFVATLLPALAANAPDPSHLAEALQRVLREAPVESAALAGHLLGALSPSLYVTDLAGLLAGDADESRSLFAVGVLERLARGIEDVSGPARAALAEPGLRSRHERVREASARALATVGTQGSLGRLREADGDPSPRVRAAAREAVERIGAAER